VIIKNVKEGKIDLTIKIPNACYKLINYLIEDADSKIEKILSYLAFLLNDDDLLKVPRKNLKQTLLSVLLSYDIGIRKGRMKIVSSLLIDKIVINGESITIKAISF
jgi:hypothetical protein